MLYLFPFVMVMKRVLKPFLKNGLFLLNVRTEKEAQLKETSCLTPLIITQAPVVGVLTGDTASSELPDMRVTLRRICVLCAEYS